MTPVKKSDNRPLYVHSTPSTNNVADIWEDGCDIWNRISPFFSSGPSTVQMPTCVIVNDPTKSFVLSFPVTLAVNYHSPSTPAYPIILHASAAGAGTGTTHRAHFTPASPH